MSKNVYVEISGLLAAMILENEAGDTILHLLVDENKADISAIKKANPIAIWSDGEELPKKWSNDKGEALHSYLGHEPQTTPLKVGEPVKDPEPIEPIVELRGH